MSTKPDTFESVWDALADTPAEAARLRARSEMLMAVKLAVAKWNVTQSEAAKRLGVTQPRLNDLLRGRVTKFSIDALFDLAVEAGLRPTITVHGVPGHRRGATGKALVRRTIKTRKPRAAAEATA